MGKQSQLRVLKKTRRSETVRFLQVEDDSTYLAIRLGTPEEFAAFTDIQCAYLRQLGQVLFDQLHAPQRTGGAPQESRDA